MIRIVALMILTTGPVAADTLVAARTIPARSIIRPEDILMRDVEIIGGVSDPALAVGQEARVALYAGRPIRIADLALPAIVERNQIVRLVYENGGIMIVTEGRALDRAGPGERIRVMNLSSRATVSALVDASGAARVLQ